MRRSFGNKSMIISACLFLCLLVISAQAVAAQFTENFGKAGTVRSFRGQVRDGLDQSISSADITITNVTTRQSYEITADENGVFRKEDLPRGEYEVRVHGAGFNLAQYTVKIDPSGSKVYVITRLSPGCGSGNSGVALVKRLKDRSYTDEN